MSFVPEFLSQKHLKHHEPRFFSAPRNLAAAAIAELLGSASAFRLLLFQYPQ